MTFGRIYRKYQLIKTNLGMILIKLLEGKYRSGYFLGKIIFWWDKARNVEDVMRRDVGLFSYDTEDTHVGYKCYKDGRMIAICLYCIRCNQR